MLGLTRKSDYALVALVYLAQTQGQEPAPVAVSARDIADQFGLPVAQFMNILKDLARAHLVQSTRGAGGGYALAVAPEQITLLEVVTAMEGPMRLAQCCAGELPVLGQPGCSIAQECPTQGPIRRLHQRINDFLEQTTVADLIGANVDVPSERVGV